MGTAKNQRQSQALASPGLWRAPPTGLRAVIQPGDMLCFCCAHLHASVPNTSGRARFSIETRTVNIDDIHNERGAPNVDCAASEIMTTWFRHIEGNYSLADAVAFR